MSDLLPPNSSQLERGLAAAQQHLGALPVHIRHIRNPLTCPTALLPFLAWELSVDEWNPDWSEEVKRRVIAESLAVHRRKGTRGAVRRALEAIFGEGKVTLLEGVGAGCYDGSGLHNGINRYGNEGHWARYSVFLGVPITRRQAAEVRRVLAWVAPARCHLMGLNFDQASYTYNGEHRHNTTITHGVA